ncbi:hypothetical protein Ddc_16889 [Ditylenchus destructor]|nr:hypothetical protein Ddc_16889 [Ditylenchus destructor]
MTPIPPAYLPFLNSLQSYVIIVAKVVCIMLNYRLLMWTSFVRNAGKFCMESGAMTVYLMFHCVNATISVLGDIYREIFWIVQTANLRIMEGQNRQINVLRQIKRKTAKLQQSVPLTTSIIRAEPIIRLLSTETIAEILRHFSRKKLSQELYLVNRNIWQIARSRHLVPNLHLIKDLCIDTIERGDIKEKNSLYGNIIWKDYMKKSHGNIIRIASAVNSKPYIIPVSYFVKKMPTPEPFVRFGKVWIKHCEDESLVEFLRNANESFIGCDLRINFYTHNQANHIQKKLAYLLANAFIKPAQILIDVKCDSGLQQILQTEGVSNCNKLIFCPNDRMYYTQQFHDALLNWLQNYGREEKRMIQAENKVLVLHRYPEKMILSLVEHLKHAFQDDTSPPSAFLITFHVAAPNLDGEQLNFPLSKVHTGEKLSFFKGKDCTQYETFVYRLWRRRVINERADRMMEWQYKHTNLYHSISHFY